MTFISKIDRYDGTHFDFVKLENILKDSLDLISSPSYSVKIQIMGWKVCLRRKGKKQIFPHII